MSRVSYNSGLANFRDLLRPVLGDAKEKVVSRQKAIMLYLTDRILELTPVWEGDSIVNWKWSIGSPDTHHVEARGQSMPPGATNRMLLGEEPRRPENEAVVRRSAMDVILALKEPADIYFTNTSDSIIDLEYGRLPTPALSRSRPHGIVRLAIKEATGRLR